MARVRSVTFDALQFTRHDHYFWRRYVPLSNGMAQIEWPWFFLTFLGKSDLFSLLRAI